LYARTSKAQFKQQQNCAQTFVMSSETFKKHLKGCFFNFVGKGGAINPLKYKSVADNNNLERSSL